MTRTAIQLHESVAVLAEASSDRPEPGRMRIRLIEGDRWGSSGYYSNEVLERDGAAAFPAGTQMYLDHPTFTEDAERPERSVRDLAGRLTEAARFDSDGLYADVEVFPHWRPLIEGLSDAIGLSIRAGGIREQGEAPDGRSGPVVTALAESNGSHSVDFVTRAGAGGQIMDLLESARSVVLHEGHGMTANDLRDLLSSAVEDAQGGDGIYVWVRDYTDDWVVFERSGDVADAGLFQQSYTVNDGQVTFSGDPAEVVVHTEYRPAGEAPPAAPTVASETDVQEGAMPNPTTDQLQESVTTLQGQVTQLQESVSTLTAERDTAILERNQLRACDAARTTISEALAAESEPLSAATQARVTESVLADVPLNEAGELDTAALTERVTAASTAERSYAASLLEEAGVGRVRGVGSSGGALRGEAPTKPEDYQARGLSESAAKVLSNR